MSAFKVLAGLAAAVIATGLPHVAAIAFDADGRLWAATAGYSDDGSDAIYVVDAPGATPKAILTNLHTPLGLVWDGGVLYAASAGRIDAYSGLSNGAFATRRTVVTFEAGVGEVNGLALAPDGRLVVGVSAACDACTPGLETSGRRADGPSRRHRPHRPREWDRAHPSGLRMCPARTISWSR